MPHEPVYIEFSGKDEQDVKTLLNHISHHLHMAGHSVEGLVKGMEPTSVIKVVVHD